MSSAVASPSGARAHLEVALQANAAAYRRAVQAGGPGECWDFVILTAANEKQAQGYRQELALRERAVGPTGAFFPAVQRTLVVPDPPNRRAGSGGATLAALATLINRFDLGIKDIERLRILLIHSGGASQRLPAYSPLGKIFAPLPLVRPDGQIATLFDHLYITLAGLPERVGPGLLVLAGDVFLLFDHRYIATPPAGVTAISMRVDAELGCAHGVFVTDPHGRVTRTLQKVSVQDMDAAGATDDRGQVLIDTGLLFFDVPGTTALARLAGAGERSKKPARGLHDRFRGQIDLYDEIAGVLATGTRRQDFLQPKSARPMRSELWSKLRDVPFHAAQIAGEFLHLGTTRQFRDAMTGRSASPAAELFQRNVLAHSGWEIAGGRRVYHSVLRADTTGRGGTLGDASVVEHSILCPQSHVGAGSVVSQVLATSRPIDVPENVLLFQVPVRDDDGTLRFVQVVCGIEDDFKGSFAEGKCIYFNQPIGNWLEQFDIRPDEIWPQIPRERRTLWTARLFIATPARDTADLALPLAREQRNGRALATWRKSKRYSMAMVLASADPEALIAHREVVAAALQSEQLIASIRRGEDQPLDALIGRYMTADAYAEAERLLNENAAGSVDGDAALALTQARALWSASQLLSRPDHPAAASARQRIDSYMQRAFAKVAQASEIGYLPPAVGSEAPFGSQGEAQPHGRRHARRGEGRGEGRRRGASDFPSPQPSPGGRGGNAKLRPGLEVTATAPVRLDLAGGWTDTPPYCFERGGHVVNLAINLDGRPPVRAVVRTLQEPRLILESHDLGRKIEPDSLPAELDVRDPFALHRIALSLTGLVPMESSDLRQRLRALGSGLHITTESRVPKGSGLGTSSILAAALLAALHRVRGRTPSTAALIEQTLLLEQRLSTGGGWQDQVGGIVGGIKSTLTTPGVPQRPMIEQLELTDAQYAALEQRLVVYYSGQQRLARDILRRVMGRWLAREPAMQSMTESLKETAASLRTALSKSRWLAAAKPIARYWQIKKELYPGSTTPAIDLLLLELRDDYLAAGLAGAGGGGFAYFLCRDPRQAHRLRQRLAEFSSRPGFPGSVYSTQINRDGLLVKSVRIR
ncbi:MAG TPA: L-fucokinase [Tepidisphaeraceae bacterium]|nr:L-fucokinase [Tepidisphaeraceae bacterium]